MCLKHRNVFCFSLPCCLPLRSLSLHPPISHWQCAESNISLCGSSDSLLFSNTLILDKSIHCPKWWYIQIIKQSSRCRRQMQLLFQGILLFVLFTWIMLKNVVKETDKGENWLYSAVVTERGSQEKMENELPWEDMDRLGQITSPLWTSVVSGRRME